MQTQGEPRRTFEEFLLQLRFSYFYFHGFIHLFRVTAPVIGIVFDRSWKERIDKRCFSQPWLTGDLG